MWFTKYKRGTVLLVFILCCDVGTCQAITNAQFNASLRDYSAPEDSNTTEVRTLQKDLSERYAHQAPVSNIIRFKEVPDSAISGSSHGRGLLHLNHHGYGLVDYEESPHYGSGFEYQYPEDHHGHYDDDHHSYHSGHHGHHAVYHDDHKHGYGHHHKHYDHHALAAKTVLWPIAGIALLGAAAALVTNPVLLQLGVVSGRRRRRNAAELTKDDKTKNSFFNEEFVLSSLKNVNKNDDTTTHTKRNKGNTDVKRNVFNKASNNNNHRLLFGSVNKPAKAIQSINANTPEHNRYSTDKHYIPIPLKIKENADN